MRRAFTLIELLVVITIIALLVGIILPSLGLARRSARSAACLSGLRQIAAGQVLYTNDHKEAVIPSYNMKGIDGAGEPLDGWAPILDRDDYIAAPPQARASVFYCPDTFDVEGVRTGQTGSDPNNPKGWMDWPFTRTGTSAVPTTIPERGFERIIRVSYWVNSDNPIGGSAEIIPDQFFTGSVGYGPGSGPHKYIKQTRLSAFSRPFSLIAFADGVYGGRQRDTRIGTTNNRVGYRHPGKGGGAANTGFADGHARSLSAADFPRGLGGSNPPAEVREENSHGRPTVYADPDRVAWAG